MFVFLLVMSAKNRAKALDEAIVYALPRVGKASINIKQQQREATCISVLIMEKMCLFSWLLTGFDKLLCYEALPYVIDYKLGTDCSMVLVILLLVSLMIDQVQSLYARGVPAAILRSNIFEYLSIFVHTHDGYLQYIF